jgi:phosphoglycolate phosphatase (TIGR01487 family)
VTTVRPRPGPALRGLVTDIDGTLTDRSRRLNTEAIEHLRKVQDRGAAVVLATGNVLPVALAIHRSIGLTGPIVAENGGLVYRKVEGRDVVERLARRSVALAAYRTLRARGIPVRRLFSDRWRETEVALEQPAPLRAIRAALAGTDVTAESTGYAIHLMERGAGKRTGLARALGPLGLSLAECFVAGDGDNDVAMLRAAGFGASFPNGSARARAAATFVSRRPYAEGFVEALMRSGLVPRSGR